MTNIIFTSLSGETPLNIYVSDAFGGNETYLGQVNTLPIVGGLSFDLPEIFHLAPQVTIIVQDNTGCRTSKKYNCYINCDIIYSITDITSITPTPTPTPSTTPGYIPPPTTNYTITLNGLTGTTPLNVYVSDVNGDYETYVATIVNTSSLPVTIGVPTIFDGANQIMITIKDSNSCSYFKIIDCGVVSTSPTPTNTVTPTVTPTNPTSPTTTPTPTITPSNTTTPGGSTTPTNTITPTTTPTNTITPTRTITPSPTQTPTTNSNVLCIAITRCSSGSICDCTGNPYITMYYSGTLDEFNNPDSGVFYQTLNNCENVIPDYNGLTYLLDTSNQLYWQPDINGEINGYNICI